MITSPTVTPARVTRPDRCFAGSSTFRARRDPPPPPPVVSPLPYSNNHFFVKLLLDMTLLRNEWVIGFVPAAGIAEGVEFGVMKDSSGRRCWDGGGCAEDAEFGGNVGTFEG